MRTDQLIEMLAREPEPVPPGAVRRRHAAALGWGLAGSAVLLALFLGVRDDLAEASRLPMFWVKLALPLLLLALAVAGAARLSRPGVALGRVAAGMPLPVLGIWALAGVALVAAAPGERVAMLMGETWRSCPFNIAMLSAPFLAGAFWAMRGLAPTRLALAGAFAGLMAGAAGALVYCLHCPEMSPAFIGTWYLLGIAIPAVAGYLLGPRLLRW
ncbi:MAG: NrsF family protein [Burkholderiales bacterium]